MSDFSHIEAPPPLDHWRGQTRIHPDNQKIIQENIKPVLRELENPPEWQFWRKNELKIYVASLEAMNEQLETLGVNKLLQEFAQLEAEREETKVKLFNLKKDFEREEDPNKCEELTEKGRILYENLASIRRDKKIITSKLKPYRKLIQNRDKAAARIEEHYSAIQEKALDKLMTVGLDDEALLVEKHLTIALMKLGFYHKRTKRDMFGKVMEIKQLVKFQRRCASADKIMLKVDVSQLGLLNQSIDNLPYGVRAGELIKPEILYHLSVAIERPVSSPNATGDADGYQGIWYVVDRLGLRDQIPKEVGWSEVMKRYPEEQRHLMPVPMGLREGRKINWVNLRDEPHIMLNGVTGGGKSNAVQMALATLVWKNSPDEIQFIIADVKDNGDFRQFVDLPHVIKFSSDIDEIAELTVAFYHEMKRRNKLIRQIATKIDEYNLKVSEPDRLPHIYFIFDEYPAIGVEKQAQKLIHHYSAHIAMQGRASGIHWFITGQQSYREDFPRQLTGNITYHLTARQQTTGAALSTTGNTAAKRLAPNPGRLMVVSGWNSFEIQMPKIEEHEIHHAVEAAKRWGDSPKIALPMGGNNTERNEEISPVELVLQLAFEEFNGDLKARAIWEASRGQLSLPQTTKIVGELVGGDSIEYEGISYEAIKQRGNFYRLFAIESESEELPETA